MAAAFGPNASSAPPSNPPRSTAPLALVATAILLASLSVALALAGWLSYRAEYREAQQRSMGIARLMATQTARMIETADLLLVRMVDLAGSTDWSRPDAAATAQRELKTLRGHLPYILEYGIVDADGNLRITDSAVEPDPKVADRPYFTIHRDSDSDSGLFIGRPFLARRGPPEAGQKVFALSRRITDADGRFSGVAVIILTASDLAAYYHSFGGDLPLTFHLIDRDAKVLVRDPPLPLSSPLRTTGIPELRAAIGGGIQGMVRAPLGGTEHVWSYQKVDAYPLYATVDFKTASVLHRWLDRAIGYILFSLAALAALAALSYELVQHARKEDRLRRRLVSADALRLSEERYRGIVEDQIELVCRFLPDTTLTFVNRACARYFGRPPGDLVGQKILALTNSGQEAYFLAHLASLTPERPVGRIEWRWTDADGLPHCHIWTTRAIFDPNGNQVEFQGVGTDISELKRAEEALLLAKAQAEEASLSKTRFLMAASHDLRQPLQTIGTLAALLETSIDGLERRRCLESLREAHGSIVILLNTLLDMSRLEMGGSMPRIADFPASQILDPIRREFEPLARAEGLDFRVVRSGAILRSDPGLVKQLVQNLVSNAMKYTVTGKVLLGCRRSSSRIRIEVWDTGIGIAEEEHERIFEEFYQIDNPARERSKGYGLGLPIARRIADLLGCRIEMRSIPGKGSVFRITLPRGTAWADSGESSRPSLTEAEAPREASVLLIEDDPAVLDSLGLLLRLEGFEVTTAARADEAGQRIRNGERPPDIIIADYRLPGGQNGLEAIHSIRAYANREIPGIILTGDVSRSIARRIEEAGCALLHKPGDTGELIGLVHKMLRDAKIE